MSGLSRTADLAESNRFRPDMERLESREAPAAVTLPDFYNVRAGRILNRTARNINGVAGVLRNDNDSAQGTPPPFRNAGMRAVLTSQPIDLTTGLPVSSPFSFQSDGGFTFRAPRNFNGPVRFTYIAIAADGSVSGNTTALISVSGPIRRVAIGADEGSSPTVTVYDATTTNNLFTFNAFDPGFQGGVRVATADFNGDNVDDIVCAAGPGAGPHVKIFDGRGGGEIASFFAFGSNFKGGVELSTGDLNGDDVEDLVVSAGSGADAHVKVIDGTKVAQGGFDANNGANLLASFYAYGTGETKGVRTAVGDLNGTGSLNGTNQLITAPVAGGTGSGTLVKAFDFSSGAPQHSKAFFAGNPADSRGLFVTAGDFNGDLFDDIAVGSGSGRPEARIYIQGADPTAMVLERSLAAASYADNFVADAFANPFVTNPEPDFLVGTLTTPTPTPTDLVGTAVSPKPGYRQGYAGGMRVAADYANRDNFADLMLAQGPGSYPRVLILSGQDLSTLADFSVFPGFFGGLNIAGHF